MKTRSERSSVALSHAGAVRRRARAALATAAALPERFQSWFHSRGWEPRAHQLELVRQAERGRSTLLIAPTGAGKTLAGFLPSLVDLDRAADGNAAPSGVHTLYISPLKALAVDVARNLLAPIEEMGLPIRVETRTGDTPVSRRQRQRLRPPHMLLTTPEQVALLLSYDDAARFFADLKCVVVDELHAMAPSKRGDLLCLGLARLRRLAPDHIVLGLSATVARPTELRAWLRLQAEPDRVIELADLVETKGGAKPRIRILDTEADLPWATHTARYATPEIYDVIKAHRLSLLFVNTRMQAELLFQELWRINDDNLPIALHHGSLAVGQRRKVEAAMAAGRLRAVVATSTLDLGIDWGDVDLVVNVGAPKGASRLIQRVGRANHRLDEPSEAILVPANRFEVIECRAALEAAEAGAQDAVTRRRGALDVLAQHVLGTACAGPFHPDQLFAEVRSTAPYAQLQRTDFDRVVDFVATGGYALRSYDRFARLKPDAGGKLRLAHPRLVPRYRLNVGTIVEGPLLKVRLVGRGSVRRPGARQSLTGGRVLGEVDEYFASEMVPGDTFVFGGEVVRLEGIRELNVYVSRASASDPKIPSYPGGKFPLSTHLAQRVRSLLAEEEGWARLPAPVSEWLGLQQERSVVPRADEVLIETFQRANRHFLVAYPFEGRLAHQTLGMLLTRRLDRAKAAPTGFVASDYALAVWGLGDLSRMIADGTLDLGRLFDEDMLGDDLEAWLAESGLMRRTFRACATIAGLVERRHPGHEKSGRQLTVSTDLIYQVLRRYEPRHVLLEAAYQDAATGLLDVARLQDFLRRIKGRIRHIALPHVSPLAVPILLDIGKEPVNGTAREDILREAADALVREAMGSA
ncbi:MAG: ligase-associated DNA damage response DEXH box helicase [Bacteroidota bacterium]